jgi:hypothetical protein
MLGSATFGSAGRIAAPAVAVTVVNAAKAASTLRVAYNGSSQMSSKFDVTPSRIQFFGAGLRMPAQRVQLDLPVRYLDVRQRNLGGGRANLKVRWPWALEVRRRHGAQHLSERISGVRRHFKVRPRGAVWR